MFIWKYVASKKNVTGTLTGTYLIKKRKNVPIPNNRIEKLKTLFCGMISSNGIYLSARFTNTAR